MKTKNKTRKLSSAVVLIGLQLCISCTTSAPNYETIGAIKDGGANIHFIVVDVPDLKEIEMSSLEQIAKDLIKQSNAQQMFEANTAYYFFDKSQQVELNLDYTRHRKAYYWYGTRLLIHGRKQTEINWK